MTLTKFKFLALVLNLKELYDTWSFNINFGKKVSYREENLKFLPIHQALLLSSMLYKFIIEQLEHSLMTRE